MDAVRLQSLLNLLAIVLIPVGIGGTGFLLLREAILRARRRARLLPQEGPAQAASGSLEVMGSLAAGVRRIGDRIAIQDPAQLPVLRARLVQAGFFGRDAVAFYLGTRVTTLAAGAAAVMLMLPLMGDQGGVGAVALAAAFGLAAIMGPEQVLKMRIADREREYRDGFPDLLDLLVASVEAGLSLDAAVARIEGELGRRYPRLTEHLKLLTLELRAGRSRREVWSRLADRLGIDEARSFATMLRQAEEMGSSLGDTLKVFSDDMRTKRMLRAEEKALALPAKLVVPLILFIFPCLLGVLILPAAFRVAQIVGQG